MKSFKFGLIEKETFLVRWSFYKYKCLQGVGSKKQGSSLHKEKLYTHIYLDQAKDLGLIKLEFLFAPKFFSINNNSLFSQTFSFSRILEMHELLYSVEYKQRTLRLNFKVRFLNHLSIFPVLGFVVRIYDLNLFLPLFFSPP